MEGQGVLLTILPLVPGDRVGIFIEGINVESRKRENLSRKLIQTIVNYHIIDNNIANYVSILLETGQEKLENAIKNKEKKEDSRSDDLRDPFYCLRIHEGGDISYRLAHRPRPDDTTHDLAGPRLGHVIDEVYRFRRADRS